MKKKNWVDKFWLFYNSINNKILTLILVVLLGLEVILNVSLIFLFCRKEIRASGMPNIISGIRYPSKAIKYVKGDNESNDLPALSFTANIRTLNVPCARKCDARFYLCTSPLTDDISKVGSDYIYNNFTDDQLRTASFLRENIKSLSTSWAVVYSENNDLLIFSPISKEIIGKLTIKKEELRAQCERVYRECRNKCKYTKEDKC